MKRLRSTIQVAAICAVLLMAIMAAVLIGGAWHRGRVITGVCDAYNCLLRDPSLSVFADFIPASALDIHYSLAIAKQYYEATFTCDEQEFLKWAMDQGWDSDAIQRNTVGPLVVMFYLPSPESSTVKSNGYHLRTLSASDSESELDETRIIAYDCVQSKAYFQLWRRDFMRPRRVNELILK